MKKYILKTYYFIKKFAILPLLCLMIWQQWESFLVHEEKIVKPTAYIQKYYDNDYTSVYGRRYEELKKYINKPCHITYFGDTNLNTSTILMHYYQTQYFLSPNIILNDSLARDTILYNMYFTLHIDLENNFYLKNGWKLIKDFNNGLILIAK